MASPGGFKKKPPISNSKTSKSACLLVLGVWIGGGGIFKRPKTGRGVAPLLRHVIRNISAVAWMAQIIWKARQFYKKNPQTLLKIIYSPAHTQFYRKPLELCRNSICSSHLANSFTATPSSFIEIQFEPRHSEFLGRRIAHGWLGLSMRLANFIKKPLNLIKINM